MLASQAFITALPRGFERGVVDVLFCWFRQDQHAIDHRDDVTALLLASYVCPSVVLL